MGPEFWTIDDRTTKGPGGVLNISSRRDPHHTLDSDRQLQASPDIDVMRDNNKGVYRSIA